MSRTAPQTVRVVSWGAALCLAAFAVIALLVSSGQTASIDRQILLIFRELDNAGDAWGPAWFEEAAAEVTTLGGYTILSIVTLFVTLTLLFLHKYAATTFLLAAVITGSVVSTVAKLLFDRPRPDLVDHLDVTFTSSFPSAHAMISTLTWLTLAAIAIRFVTQPRLRVLIFCSAIGVSVMVGISRVYLGVHWPSDVLAGWFIGAAWAGICWICAHLLSRRRDAMHADLGRSFSGAS